MTQKQEASISSFTLETMTLILHIMRNLRSSSTDMDLEIELSYPQILMLYALLENGTSTMSEVSRWLKISHGVATRTVDRMVVKGVVERRHGDEDRRQVLVSLTRKGEEYAEAMLASHLERLNGVLESVGEQQKRSFLELLRQIDKKLEE